MGKLILVRALKNSLVIKIYLYAAGVLVVAFFLALATARVLVEQGQLDTWRQFGADQALYLGGELERGMGPRGPDPRQLARLAGPFHARLDYRPVIDHRLPADLPPQLASHKVFFEPGGLPGPSWRHYWVRLDRAGQPHGVLEVAFEPPHVPRPHTPFFGAFLWLALLALMVVPPLIVWVTRPLRAMVAVAHRLGQGDLHTPVAVHARDEFGELETAFEGLRVRVQRMLAEKESLLRDISHELRAPLSRMAIAVPLLESLQLRPEAAPYLGQLSREITAMDALIQEILELARAREAQGRTSLTLDLADLARELVAERALPMAERALVLTTALAAAAVQGDERLIRRAMGNLFDNALKYTPPQGAIHLETGVESGQAYFRVVDNGPGIPAAELPHLFAPFYRPDSSRSRETGGTGLGLAIVQAIAESHHGSATLAAVKEGDTGTIAELRLPTT